MAVLLSVFTHACVLILVAFDCIVRAAPTSGYGPIMQQSSGKMVFCHFMVLLPIQDSVRSEVNITKIGVVSDRTCAADYDADMTRAKSLGIDAFALNIGIDKFTDEQLGYAYQSAANNGMKVFISFDFNWWNTSQAADVGAKIKQYGGQAAQLKVGSNGDQVFVSSFAGDGLNLDTVRSAAGMPLFIAPNFQASNAGSADGALNWMAWPNNGHNKAPAAGSNVTVEAGDQAYISALAGKPYIAPVSAWFSTHYGSEVTYSKNWVFPSDLLWYNRWMDILTLAPQYVEIITWNDYGESHYIGPLSSPHYDDGNSKWVNDMPHDGWQDMAKPFIAAYKAGSKSVGDYITSDQIIYWYRPTLKSANCDLTDNTMKPADDSTGNFFQGLPNGADAVSDSIFVVALLTAAGTVQVSSGSNSQTFEAQAGANAWAVSMGIGKQSFSLIRGGNTILSGTSLKDVSADCICGIYNFNAYVGTLPPGQSDTLQSPAGFQAFASGLSPGICQPTPSLGTVPIVNTAPTGTGTESYTTISSQSLSTVTSAPQVSSSTTSSVIAPPVPPITTATTSSVATYPAAPITTTPTTTSQISGGVSTVTSLSQLFPTNCMQAGQVWAGPAGSDPPAKCGG